MILDLAQFIISSKEKISAYAQKTDQQPTTAQVIVHILLVTLTIV
jgi:hypothetical protein